MRWLEGIGVLVVAVCIFGGVLGQKGGEHDDCGIAIAEVLGGKEPPVWVELDGRTYEVETCYDWAVTRVTWSGLGAVIGGSMVWFSSERSKAED